MIVKIVVQMNTPLSFTIWIMIDPKEFYGSALDAIQDGTKIMGEPMADMGRWFKLWCAAVYDPDLDNLDIADFGRWAKLGAIIKEQGDSGKIILIEPARSICSALQVSTFNDLISCINKMPNITVSNETSENVSYTIEFKNWLKYQANISTDRVRKFRAKKGENETAKKRGEENKNKKRIPPIIPQEFISFWEAYPNKKGRLDSLKAWNIAKKKGLLPPIEKIIEAIKQQKADDQWCKDGGQYIPNPATWLNQGRWDDRPIPWTEKVRMSK